MAGKWYKTGFDEGLKGGPQDPPWSRGHRDHAAYCEGYAIGEHARQAEDNPDECCAEESEDEETT